MDLQTAKNILVFLNRANITGQEAEAMLNAKMAISAIIKSHTDSDPNEAKKEE